MNTPKTVWTLKPKNNAPRAAQRDANEPAITAWLEIRGATTIKLDVPVDLLVGSDRGNVLLEVKDGSKPLSAQKLTTIQDEFLHGSDKYEAYKGEVYVVRSIEEVDCVFDFGEWCEFDFGNAMRRDGWRSDLINGAPFWVHTSGKKMSHREWWPYWAAKQATPTPF
jgi:hypothetical protein